MYLLLRLKLPTLGPCPACSPSGMHGLLASVTAAAAAAGAAGDRTASPLARNSSLRFQGRSKTENGITSAMAKHIFDTGQAADMDGEPYTVPPPLASIPLMAYLNGEPPAS